MNDKNHITAPRDNKRADEIRLLIVHADPLAFLLVGAYGAHHQEQEQMMTQ